MWIQSSRRPVCPTVRRSARLCPSRGRHKKQTGGSGQFGDVWVRFEPNFDEEEMVFAEEVFGGSVPKNFFPAVEKGLREACVHGPLAGYPVVNLKAVLYDGSYHPVDSSEIAFKTAAQLAYKAAMPEANPVLLEPVGELKVTVPDSYMGDVIGDLNKRRGRVMGMTPTADGEQIIEAEVPMAEMTSYAIDLRAMTQSRGSFVFHFVRYEDCPPLPRPRPLRPPRRWQRNKRKNREHRKTQIGPMCNTGDRWYGGPRLFLADRSCFGFLRAVHGRQGSASFVPASETKSRLSCLSCQIF